MGNHNNGDKKGGGGGRGYVGYIKHEIGTGHDIQIIIQTDNRIPPKITNVTQMYEGGNISIKIINCDLNDVQTGIVKNI